MTVELQWDPNTEHDLAGYRVYYKSGSSYLPFDGTDALEGASPLAVQYQTIATLSGLDPSCSYSFAVTAYNYSGVESAFSNIVTVSPTVVNASSPFLAGDINGDGVVDTLDAMIALQIAVRKTSATSDQLIRGDVAPLVNGKSSPDGRIDSGDAYVILTRVVM
jgi:hypothetical protein